MQFVLNASFNPHFCALFDESGQVLAASHWDIPKQDGEQVWRFLAEHLKAEHQLTFIGGITGPGSFSSLRTAGAVLNALSFRYQLPIHQARADMVVQDYLTGQNQTAPFLLNSFSQRLFLPDGGELKVLELEAAAAQLTEPVITSWLPGAKAQAFSQTVDVDPLGPLQTILNTLKRTEALAQFVPDYEYPPVQK